MKIQKDGCEKEILDNIIAWAPFSKHNILVTNDDFQIVKVNTQTGEMETMYQFDHSIKGINTNGVLIFWYTETEVYRYYIPEKQLDLIATDETIYAMLPSLSTTDICWQSYSPLWLKKYYELGSEENIYGIQPMPIVFCDTQTGNTYRWQMSAPEDDYMVQGVQWYYQQRENQNSQH